MIKTGKEMKYAGRKSVRRDKGRKRKNSSGQKTGILLNCFGRAKSVKSPASVPTLNHHSLMCNLLMPQF